MIQPMHDRVLIQRLEEPQGTIMLTDAEKGMKGKVLAVGPGKWRDGYFYETTVKPGALVCFSSKWNDLAEDFYDNLPVGADKTLHLVQEADILAVINA